MKDFINENKFILIIIGSVLFIVGGIWFYSNQNNDNILILEQDTHEESGNIQDEEDGIIDDNHEAQEQPKEIMVHIIGQVKNPGVVSITEGTRLIEAIEKLGGPLEEADLDAVNLSQKLVDEQKIYIPKMGEKTEQDIISSIDNTNLSKDDRININTCSQQELMTLPGIGQVISGNIINYRESKGGFKDIEEIKEVNRIGDKIFNDIKDKIKV